MKAARNKPFMLFIIAMLVVILAIVLSMKNVKPILTLPAELREEIHEATPQDVNPHGDVDLEKLIQDNLAADVIGQGTAEQRKARRQEVVRSHYPGLPQSAASIPAEDTVMFTLKTACRLNVMQINKAVERWHLIEGQWPKDDLSDIGRHKDYFPSGIPKCPVDNSRYRLDPDTHRVAGHTHNRIRNMRDPFGIEYAP